MNYENDIYNATECRDKFLSFKTYHADEAKKTLKKYKLVSNLFIQAKNSYEIACSKLSKTKIKTIVKDKILYSDFCISAYNIWNLYHIAIIDLTTTGRFSKEYLYKKDSMDEYLCYNDPDKIEFLRLMKNLGYNITTEVITKTIQKHIASINDSFNSYKTGYDIPEEIQAQIVLITF